MKEQVSGNFKIPVNQLASFSSATPGAKRKIVRNQKTPSKSIIPFLMYRMAKARITKSLKSKGNLLPVLEGIEELKKRTPETDFQRTHRTVSIEAMERFVKLQVPKLITEPSHEILPRQEVISVMVNDVEVVVSPEVVLRFEVDGVFYYGGAKIHIAKGDKFDKNQQQLVATALHHYLEVEVAGPDDVVLPELCLSVDVFGEGIISAPEDPERYMMNLITICEEVKKQWNAA